MPNQRAYPNLLDNSRESVQAAFNQAFDYIYQLQSSQTGKVKSGTATGISGLHVDRISDFPATSYAPGTIFFETDRTLSYIVEVVNDGSGPTNKWIYQNGIYKRIQNQLAALKATLTTLDNGMLVEVTDFAHLLRWTSPNWGWGPGETGGGWGPVLFEADPSPTIGWHLYDGATTAYLKSDGSLTSITLPNLAGTAAYVKAGSPNAGPNAALAPGATVSGGSVGSNTTGITNPATTGSSATGVTTQNDSGGGVLPATGAASSVANHPHTHVMTDPTHNHTIGAPTDPGHTHTVSGITVTVDATGEPRNLVRRPWFRM